MRFNPWSYSGQNFPSHPSDAWKSLSRQKRPWEMNSSLEKLSHHPHFGHGWLNQPWFADLVREIALCRPEIILGGSICAAAVVRTLHIAHCAHIAGSVSQTEGKSILFGVGAIAHNYPCGSTVSTSTNKHKCKNTCWSVWESLLIIIPGHVVSIGLL